MNLVQLSTMTEAELQAEANEHLGRLDAPMVGSLTTETYKQYQIAQAQIFLSELDRRKQAKERVESEKIGVRDYKLELWVIALIGAELLLALVGVVAGWSEGRKQMDVLDKLNKSGAETAATLTTLRKEQEAALDTQKHTLENIVTMNDALQDEMDLNVTNAIIWNGIGGDASGHEVMGFANTGRTVLLLWGSKLGNESRTMRKQPIVVIPNTSFQIDVDRIMTKKGATTQTTIPFELYFERRNGTKYVATGILQLNGNMPSVSRMTAGRAQW
jgi:hypothetical protein